MNGTRDTHETAGTLDPLIHSPERLRIVATLAALPGGDALSFTRLQHMTGLAPGGLTGHLGQLEDAGYVHADQAGSGPGLAGRPPERAGLFTSMISRRRTLL